MNFAFGDIYLTDFDPSVGHEFQKKRPAIVIQEEWISNESSCVTIMPISSKIEKMGKTDIFLQKDGKNKLTKDSIIKVHYICTFDKSRLKHYIGHTGSPTVRQVRGYLRRHFGL